MFNRRTLLTGAAAAAAATAIGARAHAAPSWAAKYPELTLAVVPAENAGGVTDRWQPFIAYLTRELGTKVNLRIANDYAAVIEGQRAGNVHIASYGPASFARALVTDVKTTAFVIEVNSDGTKGYYSVFYVKKDSPYKTIQDLKGKSIGLVDPNSTSGYNMPLFTLNKQGIPNAEQFFDKLLVTGSHENALLALQQGTVDVCANWWNAPDDSNLTRMISKNMLKESSGKTASVDDYRIILKSDLIINSPTAYLDDMPADLKAAIKAAFLEAPMKDAAAFARLSDGKDKPWEPIDNAAYDETIKLITFVDRLKKV